MADRRSFRHWTPRYVYDRVLQEIHDRRHPDHPWLPGDVVRLLERLLLPGDQGFEWGSGRSTAWLASRTRHLTSVEGDASWHRRVQEMLTRKGLTNVTYRFHDMSGVAEADEGESAYVREIERCPNGSLDYVLVDGHARDWCSRSCLPKLKPGGLLILDNAEWYLPPVDLPRLPPASLRRDGEPANTRWSELWATLGQWRRIWITDGVTSTLLLFKSD